MIAIIDYGAGNLRSVVKAFEHLGYRPLVTNNPSDLYRATALVLPGVGAAGDTMRSLTQLSLVEPIKNTIASGKPFLGVCLGLQVLLEGSEEGGWQPCLGIIPGVVRRFQRMPGSALKIPHMGWNQVQQTRLHPLFAGIRDGANFYFVHSYYVSPHNADAVAAQTDYGGKFCSIIIRDNVVATQFHPEKSGAVGLKLYDNFARFAGLTPEQPARVEAGQCS